jgi:hypothetical protein
MSETSSKKIALLFTLLIVVVASTLWLWKRPQPQVIDSRIKVQGTKIVDRNGNEIILHGICVGSNDLWRKEGSNDRAEYYGQTYFKEEDVKDMKKLGATLLDLHDIWWSKLMTVKGEIRTQYFENWLDHFIDYCEKNNMLYILNIENLGQSSLEGGHYVSPEFVYEAAGYGTGWWQAENAMEIQADIIFKFYTSNTPEMEETRQKWIDTWTYIADRYKDNEYLVGYSLVNEPIHHTQNYQTTEISQQLGVAYSNLMERCIDAIRSTGADQIVFVDKPYLLSYSHIMPVDRPNVVWEAHVYHAPWNPTVADFRAVVDMNVEKFVVDFGKPLYVGEYGIGQISFKNQMTEEEWKDSLAQQIAYMKSKSIGGISFYSIGRLDGGWQDLKDDWHTPEDTIYIFQTIFE